MKKWIRCSLIIGAFLGLIFHADASQAAKKCELLRVQGTKIVNSKGKTVNLRGVSTHGIAWFPQYVNKKAFHSFRHTVIEYLHKEARVDLSMLQSVVGHEMIDMGVTENFAGD